MQSRKIGQHFVVKLNLSDEQADALRRGEVVRLLSDEFGELVVVKASVFDAQFDEREMAAWKQLGQKALKRWGRENPFECDSDTDQ